MKFKGSFQGVSLMIREGSHVWWAIETGYQSTAFAQAFLKFNCPGISSTCWQCEQVHLGFTEDPGKMRHHANMSM